MQIDLGENEKRQYKLLT